MHRFCYLIILLVLFSCGRKKSEGPSQGKRAFYYWQTSLYSFDWNDTTFQKLNVGKIYYRFFDVDWSDESNSAVPVAPLDYSYTYNWNTKAEVVPVVYITNETFRNLDVKESAELAKQVHHKILSMMSGLLASDVSYEVDEGYWQQDPYLMKSKDFREHSRYDSLYQERLNSVKEIQFDCDWTATTKDKYFAFLEAAAKLFRDKTISSTVRLYQYKYPKEAGVPPVKRGMLMCYNAGDARDKNASNSIFDKREVMSYIEDADYPLPLDYALPVFEWALLYQNGKLTRILPATILEEYSTYLEGEGPKYRVATEFVFGYTANSVLLRMGDEIRLESPDMNSVIETAEFLGENKNNKEAVITLYHLNQHDLQKHSKDIESIFSRF
jgi:hypothetical protein